MYLIPLIVLFPLIMAFVCFLTGKKNKALRDVLVGITGVLTFILCLFTWKEPLSFSVEGVMGLGLHLKADGFGSMYGLIAAFMWMMTTVFSKEYLAHYRNRNRYYVFVLLTLGATVGVFLSADLYTTFIFFEIMSFTSYVWVVHDETQEALRAAGTYLAIAVIGGLVMLMGLFLLYDALGTLHIGELREAAMAYGDLKALYPAGICLKCICSKVLLH